MRAINNRPPPKKGRAATSAANTGATRGKAENTRKDPTISSTADAIFLGTVAEEAGRARRRLQRAIVTAALSGAIDRQQAILTLRRLGFSRGAK